MRIRLIALAATLSIAGLAAMSVASATAPSGGSVSSGGGASAGGGGGHGGGGHGGGGHGGGGGSHGGGYGGGHFAGGGYGGGYRGGGYRGGGSAIHGAYSSHANIMASGGYVSHGARGYHIVGFQSAGLTHVTAIPRAGQASRISLALGPRMGSAATAARMDPVARVARTGIARMARVDRMHPRPGHPRPGHPPRHPKRSHVRPERSFAQAYSENRTRMPIFCEFTPRTYELNGEPPFGCPGPVKAKAASTPR